MCNKSCLYLIILLIGITGHITRAPAQDRGNVSVKAEPPVNDNIDRLSPEFGKDLHPLSELIRDAARLL